MRILTIHMIRDTLSFQGPMDIIELSAFLDCPMLHVQRVIEKAITLGLVKNIAGVYSTSWGE